MGGGALFGDIAGWILGALGVYMLIVIGVGLFFSRRITECDDHVVAG